MKFPKPLAIDIMLRAAQYMIYADKLPQTDFSLIAGVLDCTQWSIENPGRISFNGQ